MERAWPCIELLWPRSCVDPKAAVVGPPAVEIMPIEDFPFLDCYNSSHAIPVLFLNPAPCFQGNLSGRPPAVPRYALAHCAAGICAIDAAGGGSGNLAHGKVCTDEAD